MLMHPIFHLLLPVSILLLFRLEKRLFLLSPIALLPDLDYFSVIYHRALFHNVFFGALLILAVYFSFGRKPALVSSFLFLSHLALDFDRTGVGLLFPLSQNAYGFAQGGLVSTPISSIQFHSTSLSVLYPSELLAILLSLSIFFIFALYEGPFFRERFLKGNLFKGLSI